MQTNEGTHPHSLSGVGGFGLGGGLTEPPPPPPAAPAPQPLRVLGGVLGAAPPPIAPETPPNGDRRLPKSPPDEEEASLPTVDVLEVPESLRGGGGGAEPEKEEELLLLPAPLEMLEPARLAAAAPAVL